MLNNKRLSFIFSIITICVFIQNVMGQEKEICKSWKIDYFIVNGKKKLPNVEEKKNSMTFFENGNFTGVEDNFALEGKWKFDAKKKKVYLIIEGFPVKLELKIIKLNEFMFSWEAINTDDGSLRKTYMIPKE